MADFLEEEAEVASSDEEEIEEEDDDDEITTSRKKSSKKKRAAQVSDDDEEEDDIVDEAVRQELADFIQDEPIDEEPADDDERKRKRSDDEADEDLEEDDYDLIEENLGMKVKRGPKFRRVRAMEGAESDEENDRDAIANELFDQDDMGDEDEAPVAAPAKRPVDNRAPRLHAAQDEDVMDMEEEENSDTDSFIVDDDGKPIHSHKARGTRRFDDAALQEAQDIFGLDFDVEDLEEMEDEYDEEGEYEEEDEDGEVIRQTRRKKNRKSVMEVYEPSDLEHNLKTKADNDIRLADVPERFQLRSIPVEAPSPPENTVVELLEEARWIHKQLFETPSLSNQSKTRAILREIAGPQGSLGAKIGAASEANNEGGWGRPSDMATTGYSQSKGFDPKTLETRINKIKDILDFIRVQCFEDRFISTYRKEFYMPEFTSEDIHEIYQSDLLWMQLQRRRTNLVKLMTKMQEYLRKWRLENPEVFEEDDEISDEAIDIVRNAASIVELADLFSEFRMMYGRHLPSLHKAVDIGARKGPRSVTLDENGTPLNPEMEGDLPSQESLSEAPPGGKSAEVKRAVRTDPYRLYKQAGLDEFVKKFGLTAEKLAANVETQYDINKIQQEPLDPEVLAEGFTSSRCQTVVEVLKGAVSLMAWLIARNAHFRRVAREFFTGHAVLNVQATARGLKEIDENHICYAFKWLKNKPIWHLADDQYLKIVQAKKEGLLDVKLQMGLDSTGKDPFLALASPFLTVDEYTKEVTAWNDLRVKALEKAVMEVLYPAFEKEVHEHLLVESKAYVKAEIRRKLFDSINIAPYYGLVDKQADEEKWEKWDDSPWGLDEGIRVMGIAFEDNRDSAAYAIVINSYGEMLDSVKLPTLTKGGTARVNPDDIEKIVQLFRDKKPHVVAISSENRRAVDIKDALNRRVLEVKLEERQCPRETPIEIVDNLLSILYGNSETGRMEFPSYAPVLRQAISVARRLLDPLLAFAQLFNMDDDILNLNFHPLQSQLSKEEFRTALQVEFVKRVNEVGVDINECVSHPLTHGNLVQFLCGLGPRKAQHLMKVVKQNGVLVSRNQLVMICRLGPKVFVNCAGFIRINAHELSESVTGEQYVEPLDASRVHPEAYEWARKMAVDALEFDESEDGANPSDALQTILDSKDPKDAEKLEELDLEAFGAELERMDLGNKRITLDEIRRELRGRFCETRPNYRSPNDVQIFEMIVGESINEYRKGRLLAPTVQGFYYKRGPPMELKVHKVYGSDDWYCPRCRLRGIPQPNLVYDHMDNRYGEPCLGDLTHVKVSLDNGIFGLIPLDYLSDKQIELPQDRVKPRMIVHARLMDQVDATKFTAQLTCRSSDLLDKNGEYKLPKDPYYDFAAEAEAMDRETKKRNKQAPKTNFLKRVIAHPSFKNVSFEEAEKYLSPETVPPGDAIIRPSSKGNNKLTLSWKVAQGIHDHVEIAERDKENAFSLGRRLVIGDEEFDDLDEILARYVQPMAQLVGELAQHKYHVDSHCGQVATREIQREIIDRWLREQKAAMPTRIPFCFSECACSPRRFFLCHLPRDSVREEFVTVTPMGYQYRRQNFTTVNHLIKYFKDHFHEAPPAPIGNTPHPSVTPGTAMMITPGTGVTPRLGTGANLAALTQAVHTLPAHVWERLREAGGSTTRATPNVFATPRTPSGSTYNSANAGPGASPSGVTPSGATPSMNNTAPWGRAAQMWQKAMTGQPAINTPGTPSSVPATPSATNWAAAAAAWVSGNAAPAAPATNPAPAATATSAAAAWLAQNRPAAEGSPR